MPPFYIERHAYMRYNSMVFTTLTNDGENVVTHTRKPTIGERLRLERRGNTLHLIPEKDDGTEIAVSTGWTFEFSEAVTYMKGNTAASAGPGKACLESHNRNAVFVFNGVCVPLEDIIPTRGIRVWVTSFTRLN